MAHWAPNIFYGICSSGFLLQELGIGLPRDILGTNTPHFKLIELFLISISLGEMLVVSFIKRKTSEKFQLALEKKRYNRFRRFCFYTGFSACFLC